MAKTQYGTLLPNGCRIVTSATANIKTPFPTLIPDLTMLELDPGFIAFINRNLLLLPVVLKNQDPAPVSPPPPVLLLGRQVKKKKNEEEG